MYLIHQQKSEVAGKSFRGNMTRKAFAEVNNAIDNEGFEYAFVSYSNFPNIKDRKFHELREAYLDAYRRLKEYVGNED
jgi:hypothetical protein